MKTRDVRSSGRVHTSCDRLQAQPFTPSPVGIAAALKRAVTTPVSAWAQEEPNMTVGVGLLTQARLKTLHPVPERSFRERAHSHWRSSTRRFQGVDSTRLYSETGGRVTRFFNGAMPSWLTSDSAFGRFTVLRLVGPLAAFFLSAAFLSPFPSVFFFFTPTALPEALTFFGPV